MQNLVEKQKWKSEELFEINHARNLKIVNFNKWNPLNVQSILWLAINEHMNTTHKMCTITDQYSFFPSRNTDNLVVTQFIKKRI